MRIANILLPALLLAVPLRADETNTVRDFGFRPLEIYGFKNGTSRLVVADINGDGRDDILFANNLDSRLEILVRKPDASTNSLPELDDCFENKGMIVDQALKALRVADLDADGRPDIVTFGAALGLQVRYQQADGSFGEPQRIFVKDPGDASTVQTGDLDGDGRPDLLVCRNDRADLLWNTADHPFQKSTTLAFSAENSYYGDIADIDNDGTNDLVFLFGSNRNQVKVRLGRGGGRFGIEQPIDIPPLQYMDILHQKGQAPQLGVILRNRLAFRLYGFEEKTQPQLLEAQETSPSRIGLEGTNKKADPAWAVCDYDADGCDDLVVAAPALSRLHLYRGGPDGLDPEPLRIDTLSEVARISRLADGDLLVVSKKEKTAALHAAGHIERFPTILPTPGAVVAGCADESCNDCWFVCKGDDSALQLARIEKVGAASVYPLDLKNEPADLLAFHLPDGKTGLILFMPYDTPLMYLFQNDRIEPLASESFRALTQPLALSNIRLAAPGDGSTLTVAQGAIARRFAWKDGRYEAVRQFNPENPRTETVASCEYRLLGGACGTLLYDRNSGDLVHFADDSDDWGKVHIPDANQTIFNLVQLRNKTRDTVVLIDRTGINEIMGNGKRLEAEAKAEYVSPSEKPALAYASAVRLASPPRPMVALVDPANRDIELIGMRDGKLEKELVFEVFLASDFVNPKENRGTEPHDVESGDINGDGIGDLAVLSQDKLLIYLGE